MCSLESRVLSILLYSLATRFFHAGERTRRSCYAETKRYDF